MIWPTRQRQRSARAPTACLEFSTLPKKRRYMAFNNTGGEFKPPKDGTLVINFHSDTQLHNNDIKCQKKRP